MGFGIKSKVKALNGYLKNTLWFSSARGKANHLKLAKLKGAYAGKRCFIMASGPSLLKCDLSLLKNELTIASNAQFLIWDKMNFVPTFYTVEDALVAESRNTELNNIKSTTKIFPKDLSYTLNLDEKTIYINFIRKNQPVPDFADDFLNESFWGGTVSYLNLQLAYYLGCTEIYLIGFDHFFKLPDTIADNIITSETDDVNHIHPDYFGKGQKWNNPNVARMEVAYIKAKEFLTAKGVSVYNATVGGKLEVFERVEYNSLFKS